MTEEQLALSLADNDFEKKEYSPIPRIARTIPFGYEIDENDPDVLQPIPLELEALEKAKKHLKQYSYREVAQWVFEVTGRKISHEGLKRRVNRERGTKTRAHILRIAAQRAEEASRKAQAFVERYGLGDESNSNDS